MTLHHFPRLGFWTRYGVTIRPWLCVVSGAAGLVGLALAEDLSTTSLVLGAAIFLFTYGVGQALTDTTQTDTDALSAPERPLARGELHKGEVRWLSLTLLGLCGLGMAWLNPWTIPVSAVAVFGLATYTFFKREWWGGPPWNSWIVACLVWLGVLVGGGDPLEALMRPGVLAAMGSTFFGYAVFVLLGYLKDVQSDAQTGYETVAVRFGRRWAVAASGLSGAASLACSWWLVTSAPMGTIWGPLLFGLGVCALAVAHVLAWRSKHDHDAYPAIVASVWAFVALRSAEVAWVHPELTLLAVALLAMTGPALAMRPNKAQV